MGDEDHTPFGLNDPEVNILIDSRKCRGVKQGRTGGGGWRKDSG